MISHDLISMRVYAVLDPNSDENKLFFEASEKSPLSTGAIKFTSLGWMLYLKITLYSG